MPHTTRPATALIRFSFWAALLVIAGFALYPDLRLPEPAMTRGFTDKIYHVLGFMILVLLAGTAWRFGPRLGSGLVLSAIALEPLQLLTRGRGVFLADAIANLVGVAFGMLLLWTWAHRFRRR